jgi:hypothetical protein
MADIVRKLNGFPIKTKALYEELETGCLRAIPDVDYLARIFTEFFSFTSEELEDAKKQTLEGYHKHYSWDKTAKGWIDIFDNMGFGDWTKPITKTEIPNKFPENLDNRTFLEWCFKTMFPELNIVGNYEFNSLLRDLNFQAFKNNPGGFVYSENSFSGRENYQPFSRETAFNMIKNKAVSRNLWEDARCGNVTFNKENWIV